jgi:hypothetical protein
VAEAQGRPPTTSQLERLSSAFPGLAARVNQAVIRVRRRIATASRRFDGGESIAPAIGDRRAPRSIRRPTRKPLETGLDPSGSPSRGRRKPHLRTRDKPADGRAIVRLRLLDPPPAIPPAPTFVATGPTQASDPNAHPPCTRPNPHAEESRNGASRAVYFPRASASLRRPQASSPRPSPLAPRPFPSTSSPLPPRSAAPRRS